MGAAVNKRAAMIVASPSLVVALANNLSGFGAMSSSWPQVGCRSCQVQGGAKRVCDRNHILLEAIAAPGILGSVVMRRAKNGKICLPLGITTKSDFVFTQPRPGPDSDWVGGARLARRCGRVWVTFFAGSGGQPAPTSTNGIQ